MSFGTLLGNCAGVGGSLGGEFVDLGWDVMLVTVVQSRFLSAVLLNRRWAVLYIRKCAHLSLGLLVRSSDMISIAANLALVHATKRCSGVHKNTPMPLKLIEGVVIFARGAGGLVSCFFSVRDIVSLCISKDEEGFVLYKVPWILSAQEGRMVMSVEGRAIRFRSTVFLQRLNIVVRAFARLRWRM